MLTSIANYYNHSEENSNEYKFAVEFIKATKNSIFKHIFKEPSREALEILISPVFLRENLEDEVNGSMAIEEMDEIFQQEYDRFTGVTADYAGEYEDIDEALADDEESENMKPEEQDNDAG